MSVPLDSIVTLRRPTENGSIGAFQIGVRVSTKEAMLLDHMRPLSGMRWRTAKPPRRSRWRKTMLYYLDLLTAKVQAPGGNPFAIRATPDGAIATHETRRRKLRKRDGAGDTIEDKSRSSSAASLWAAGDHPLAGDRASFAVALMGSSVADTYTLQRIAARPHRVRSANGRQS